METVITQSSSAIKLKGSLFTLTILQILQSDIDIVQQGILETISKSPNFFLNAPVVLDFSELETQDINLDFKQLIAFLREQKLIPVGVNGLQNDALIESAIAAGLAKFNQPKTHTKEAKKNPTDDSQSEKQKPTNTYNKTKVIDQPVRSGQQIYAQNADLIILSSVGAGAEILADGHIHVYGELRGRVLAGVMGDTSARIYCHSLEAELISIAGRYIISENFAKRDEPTQIYLEDDEIKMCGIQ